MNTSKQSKLGGEKHDEVTEYRGGPKSLRRKSSDPEVVGPKGFARFRMTPLNVQRVQDLFAADDALHAS